MQSPSSLSPPSAFNYTNLPSFYSSETCRRLNYLRKLTNLKEKTSHLNIRTMKWLAHIKHCTLKTQSTSYKHRLQDYFSTFHHQTVGDYQIFENTKERTKTNKPTKKTPKYNRFCRKQKKKSVINILKDKRSSEKRQFS